MSQNTLNTFSKPCLYDLKILIILLVIFLCKVTTSLSILVMTMC